MKYSPALVLLHLACSSSESPTGSETSEGGTSSGSSAAPGETTARAPITPTTEAACEAPEATLIAQGEDLRSLVVTDDFVYFLDRDVVPAGAIKRYAFATAETETLYSAPEGRLIDLLVTVDTIYFLLDANLDWTVYRLPLAGGEAQTLGPTLETSLAQYALLGVEGEEVLLHRGRVLGISTVDDSVREVTGSIDAQALQMAGGRLWYTDDDLLSRPIAMNQAPTLVYEGGCTTTRLGQDWFVVTDDGIYCRDGLDAVQRLALDGSGRQIVYQADGFRPNLVAHVTADGTAYFSEGSVVQLGSRQRGRFTCGRPLFDAVGTNASHVVWATGDTLFGNASGYLPSTYDAIYTAPR